MGETGSGDDEARGAVEPAGFRLARFLEMMNDG